jgi:hypothetical protein
MNEKYYLFNPFMVQKADEKDLQELYNSVFKQLIEGPNTMYEYAKNIEVYANLMYICGEIIARLTKDIIEVKTEIEIKKAIKIVEERKSWNTEENGKQPAMSYFEALGTRFCQELIQTLAKKEMSLRRFKNAYNSLDAKMNAIKKQMEAIKYEEFNDE